jgi:type IV fimbrial biogenesis protein FimT
MSVTNRPPSLAQRGFTLIEIFVALIIVAIMVGMGVPSLRDFLMQQRISAAAQDLQLDVAVARSEAITRGDNVSVCVSNDAVSCTGGSWNGARIIFVDSNQNGAVDGADRMVRQGTVPENGVTISSAVAAPFISFNSRGAVNVARVLSVCRSGLIGRDLTIKATGHPSVSKSPGSCP